MGKRRYVPVVVEDWAQLSSDLEKFMVEQSQARRTRRDYRYGWGWWVEHCLASGWDPEDAPIEAFTTLWTRERRDGARRLAPNSVNGIVNAVVDRYKTQGRVPAHQRPEHVAEWLETRRGAIREHADAVAFGTRVGTRRATPLLRDDVARLVDTAPGSTAASRAQVAGVLLALDLGLTATELARLTVAAVSVHGSGAVRVAGRDVACDHKERARGVPWDCTACAVRAVLRDHSGDGPLLGAWSTRARLQAAIGQVFRARRRALPGLAAAVPGVASLEAASPAGAEPSSSELAGLRRALVLAGTPDGLRWVRARAWVAMSWSVGLRMCSDLRDLPREAVSPDQNRRGFRLTLAATKDDPYAAKNVVRPLRWGHGDGPSSAGLVAEYLTVRDAFGAEGRLVAEVRGGTFAATGVWGDSSVVTAAAGDLDLLCALAGRPTGTFTSYSTRRGFAQQAALDGWSLETIKRALRHADLGTTMTYLTGPSAKKAATMLMRRLA